MSIEIIETKFNTDFNNFIINDFIIDEEDTKCVFSDENIPKYFFKKPTLLISIIELNEDKYTKLVSSFTILENKINEKSEWKLIKKIDIDLCNLLILDMNTKDLDNWLEKCISSKDLYNIESDGKISINTGFGPGVYNLMGNFYEERLNALRIEFIKEHI